MNKEIYNMDYTILKMAIKKKNIFTIINICESMEENIIDYCILIDALYTCNIPIIRYIFKKAPVETALNVLNNNFF